MSNQVDSMRYLYLDASGSLASGAYLICFVSVAALSTATFTLVVLYDGQADTDPVLLKMAVYPAQTRALNIIPPVQINTGLYVTLAAGYYVTIGYVPLS